MRNLPSGYKKNRRTSPGQADLRVGALTFFLAKCLRLKSPKLRSNPKSEAVSFRKLSGGGQFPREWAAGNISVGLILRGAKTSRTKGNPPKNSCTAMQHLPFIRVLFVCHPFFSVEFTRGAAFPTGRQRDRVFQERKHSPAC